MLFTITLGAILGGAGVTLLRQGALAAFEAGDSGPVLTPAAFPRLAPPSRVPAYAWRMRRPAA